MDKEMGCYINRNIKEGIMKNWKQRWLEMNLLLTVGLVFFLGSTVMAEHMQLPMTKAVSQGTVVVVDIEGQILIIQKEDGKKVSLEVTQDSHLSLNGEARGVELLEEMEAGKTVVTVEHYINDAGMQEVVRLDVLRLK